MREKIEKLIHNIETVIVGKREIIEYTVLTFLSDGHLLLIDVSGVGKTTLAKALAFSINGQFNRIQFTPDLLPTDITGCNIYDQKSGEFKLRKGPIFTNILLADEINRSSPRTQSALLEAMEERQVTIDEKTHSLPNPFFVIATQNPIESYGTFPIPQSELDRFMLSTTIGYPSFNDEAKMIEDRRTSDPILNVKPVLSVDEIIEIKNAIKKVFIGEKIRNYILSIIHKSRQCNEIQLGASPRCSLALMRMSQAHAYLNKRDYVVPDDVKLLTLNILQHRIIVNYSTNNKTTNEKVIKKILNEISVP